MPVGDGKISAGLQAFCPERVENLLCDVGARVGMEGASFVRHLVICKIGVEHVEAVMMLCCEHDIFHPGIFGRLSPFVRIEVNRIESVFKVFIEAKILHVGHPFRAPFVFPFREFRTDCPGLNHTELAVGSPMDEHTEFQILPLCYVRAYIFLSWSDIGPFLSMRGEGNTQ